MHAISATLIGLQSAVVRSLALWLTVCRSWVRIPAAVDFVFSTSFFLLFQWGLGSEGTKLSPEQWTIFNNMQSNEN